jgi:transcriptional regulator with XRE-family HTH domain
MKGTQMVVHEGRLDVRTVGPTVLRDWMKLRGMTVRELAFRVGCSRGTVGDLRTGARRMVSPENARKIAKALDVPESQLFTTRLSTVYREVSA